LVAYSQRFIPWHIESIAREQIECQNKPAQPRSRFTISRRVVVLLAWSDAAEDELHARMKAAAVAEG
jgi:hypothetical protein